MLVDIFEHKTTWSYIAAFCTACDDFIASTKLEDSDVAGVNEPSDMEARTEAQIRMLGGATWFAIASAPPAYVSVR